MHAHAFRIFIRLFINLNHVTSIFNEDGLTTFFWPDLLQRSLCSVQLLTECNHLGYLEDMTQVL